MRGEDQRSEGLFSYVGLEARAPADHPLRGIRTVGAIVSTAAAWVARTQLLRRVADGF